MSDQQAWVELDSEDVRSMLISLIGFRFGEQPETRLAEIQAERSEYMQKFMKLAAVTAGDTVLELGSGCGFGTQALAQRAGKVIACDISPAYLSYARKVLDDTENVELRLIKNCDLSDIVDNSVDKVISTSVFIHLNIYDIHLYFREFYRILKANGKVVFDFADSHRLGGFLKRSNLVSQFGEHVEYYAQDPGRVTGLMQWNSSGGIRAAAKLAGFRCRKRRGLRLLFERLS